MGDSSWGRSNRKKKKRNESKDSENSTDDLDKSSFFDDTFVDEEMLSQVRNLESEAAAQVKFSSEVKRETTLDSDDDELIELLKELKDGAPTILDELDQSNKELPSSSDSDCSLVLSQLSQMSKERYNKEVAETLEMSQVVWDEDPFQDEKKSKSESEDEEDFFESSDVENDDKKSKEDKKDFDDDSFWESYDFDSVLESV